MVLICLFLSSFSLPRPLPASQSRPASPLLLLLLLLLLRAILLCSRCSARRKYSLFAPPLDTAKEAICALLAILEHFFEAFSPLDLFFAPALLRPVPRPFPASLHPGCRHFPPLPLPFLHRFQPIPSPARPLKSTSSRPGSHPSRRHPPVLSSSSELLSLSLAPLPRLHPACAFLPVPAAAPTLAPSCASQPLPDPVGHPAHGQNALWRWCP